MGKSNAENQASLLDHDIWVGFLSFLHKRQLHSTGRSVSPALSDVMLTHAVLSCTDMEKYAGDLYWVSLPIHCVPVTTSVTNESVHRQWCRPLFTGCYLWRPCSFFILYTDPSGQSVRWEWEAGCVGYTAYWNHGCPDGGMWTIWNLNRVMQ